MVTLDTVLDALDKAHQRATYGAVAELLRRPAQSLMAGRPRDSRHSWIVNSTTLLPTGYAREEMHPHLEVHHAVLSSGDDLLDWLRGQGVAAGPSSSNDVSLGSELPEEQSTPDQWDALDARELLTHYSSIMRALQKQGVIRSGNNPVADLAEAIGCKAFGLRIAGQSAKGYDATAPDGQRWQIKSRRVRTTRGPIQLGVIRDLETRSFDVLLAIIFDDQFRVRAAYCIPHEAVSAYAKFRSHVRGHIPIITPAVKTDARVLDVTEMVRRASEALSDPVPVQDQRSPGITSRDAETPTGVSVDPVLDTSVVEDGVKASYVYSRLCFKADVIERLQPNDRFRIITPAGTFEMSKADFYRDFANVVETMSYRVRGLYHMSPTPQKAIKYLLPGSA